MEAKSWKIPPARPVPEALEQAGYPPLLALTLACRGIETPAQAADFLSDDLFDPEDPLLLPDMDVAVARLRRAMAEEETVAVYGDYDVDGISAACLLEDYLLSQGVQTEIYIPDRLEEGYGVNAGALSRLRERGVSLLVTVDCGITAIGETEHARALGMDVIITDHHECQAVLPEAVAVVDPKRDEASPARNLAGVGVAFKLVCALSGDGRAMLDRYADLVTLGTIADVMPLQGENLRIARFGLHRLRTKPRPGLAALMELTGISRERLNAGDIGFTLAPRINAAGRLGCVQDAARLILEENPVQARAYAEELNELNRERQQLEADIWTEASEKLTGHPQGEPIVLEREDWHQGVIGIVASRLAESWHAPVVMISLNGEVGKGSCRSWGGFNLFDALTACGQYLDSFGGHAQAAGLNIRRENIGPFRQSLQAYYRDHLPREETEIAPEILIHDPRLLTMACVESLDRLEPCGNENPQPLMCLRNATLLSAIPIGGGKHTKLQLEKRRHYYDCVWFSAPLSEVHARQGERVDIAFSPRINEYRDRRTVQLVLRDLRVTEEADQCRDILTSGPFSDTHLIRSELVALWRAIAKTGTRRVPLAQLGSILSQLQSTQIALGLRVFAELSLVHLTLLPEAVEFTPLAWKEKVQLDSSPSWRWQAASQNQPRFFPYP